MVTGSARSSRFTPRNSFSVQPITTQRTSSPELKSGLTDPLYLNERGDGCR